MGCFSFTAVGVGLVRSGKSKITWHAFRAGSVRLLARSCTIPQYRLVELFRWILAMTIDGCALWR